MGLERNFGWRKTGYWSQWVRMHITGIIAVSPNFPIFPYIDRKEQKLLTWDICFLWLASNLLKFGYIGFWFFVFSSKICKSWLLPYLLEQLPRDYWEAISWLQSSVRSQNKTPHNFWVVHLFSVDNRDSLAPLLPDLLRSLKGLLCKAVWMTWKFSWEVTRIQNLHSTATPAGLSPGQGGQSACYLSLCWPLGGTACPLQVLIPQDCKWPTILNPVHVEFLQFSFSFPQCQQCPIWLGTEQT